MEDCVEAMEAPKPKVIHFTGSYKQLDKDVNVDNKLAVLVFIQPDTPNYTKIVESINKMAEEEFGYNVFIIDAHKNKEIADHFKVTKLPFVVYARRYYHWGNPMSGAFDGIRIHSSRAGQNGEQIADGIREWLCSQYELY